MEGAARTDRASKGSKPFVLSIILRSLKKALIRLDFSTIHEARDYY